MSLVKELHNNIFTAFSKLLGPLQIILVICGVQK